MGGVVADAGKAAPAPGMWGRLRGRPFGRGCATLGSVVTHGRCVKAAPVGLRGLLVGLRGLPPGSASLPQFTMRPAG